MKDKISVALDKQMYDMFRNYCKSNALIISKKIELMMKHEVGGTRQIMPEQPPRFQSVQPKPEVQRALHRIMNPVVKVPDARPKRKFVGNTIPTIDQLRIRRSI